MVLETPYPFDVFIFIASEAVFVSSMGCRSVYFIFDKFWITHEKRHLWLFFPLKQLHVHSIVSFIKVILILIIQISNILLLKELKDMLLTGLTVVWCELLLQRTSKSLFYCLGKYDFQSQNSTIYFQLTGNVQDKKSRKALFLK